MPLHRFPLVAVGSLCRRQGSRPCLEYALYFPGFNAGEVAIHDRDAITRRPDLALLTYMSTADQSATGLSRSWYNRKKPTKGLAENTCGQERKLRGVECDEYPYYTSVEAGPPNATLREVLAVFTSSEGGSRQAMISNPECKMGQEGSGTTKFLVIPLAVKITPTPGRPLESGALAQYAGPPTFHVCGDDQGGQGTPGSGDGGIQDS